MSQTTITKADLARELGISRAAITPYVQRGLPIRRDGRLDRAKALAWVRANIIPSLGGVPMKRLLAADASQCARNFTRGQARTVQGLLVQEHDKAVKQTLNFLRSASRLEFAARELLKLGLTLQQTWGACRLFAAMVIFSHAGEEFLIDPAEPDWAGLGREVGQEVDITAWRGWWNGLLDPPEPPAGSGSVQ